MKSNFLFTTPKQEFTEMVIEKIEVNNGQKDFHLEEGEHIIEMKLSELNKMDIRAGDTVIFVGDDCKGIDLSQRPADAVSFSLHDDNISTEAPKEIKKKTVRVKNKKNIE